MLKGRRQGWLLIASTLLTTASWSAQPCASGPGLPEGWRQDPHAGQVKVAAGSFTLGSQDGHADERPVRPVKVKSFWIDRTEVTNAQFEAFMQATGHVTDAERHGGATASNEVIGGVLINQHSALIDF